MSSILQSNIKKQLHDKNMTAAELERRTGIPHAVVNILHGRSKNPSLGTALAIAKELGCSLEELISEAKTAQAPQPQTNWQPLVYKQAFEAVYQRVLATNLRPSAEQIAAWITEVYLYTVGSPNLKVDQRFVEWVLQRGASSNES